MRLNQQQLTSGDGGVLRGVKRELEPPVLWADGEGGLLAAQPCNGGAQQRGEEQGRDLVLQKVPSEGS